MMPPAYREGTIALRVTTPHPSPFGRCGLWFTREPTLVLVADVGKAVARRLCASRQLRVEQLTELPKAPAPEEAPPKTAEAPPPEPAAPIADEVAEPVVIEEAAPAVEVVPLPFKGKAKAKKPRKKTTKRGR